MARKAQVPLWSLCAAMTLSTAVSMSGCAKVPRHYVRMAEPDTTLSMLVAHPEQYHGHEGIYHKDHIPRVEYRKPPPGR